MNEAVLQREETSDHGTFGVLAIGDFRCVTIELPWRDNRPGESCIPPGVYTVVPWHSARFPLTYHVRNVSGRSAILTHTGNLAGDKSKGYIRHSLGCILPGLKRGILRGQRGVLMSLPAMSRIRAILGRSPFTLTIKGGEQWTY